MAKKLRDEEIIQKQERLYELESSAMAGPPITEEEQMRRIKGIATGEFQQRMREKREARIRELPQEIANTSDPHSKARLQLDLELLTSKQNKEKQQ